MKDIELAISETLDKYRGKIDKGEAVAALRTQAELLNRDEGWVVPVAGAPTPAAEPEPEAEPEVIEPEEETSYSRSDTKKKR